MRRRTGLTILAVVAFALSACAAVLDPPSSTRSAAPSPAITPVDQTPRLAVVSVAEAQELAESGFAGRIGIRGWFSSTPPHSCPAPIVNGQFRDPNVLELYCHGGDWALSDTREAVATITVTNTARSTTVEVRGRSLEGPWLQPYLELQGAGFSPGGRETWTPVHLVLIGHFNDPRAATCDP